MPTPLSIDAAADLVIHAFRRSSHVDLAAAVKALAAARRRRKRQRKAAGQASTGRSGRPSSIDRRTRSKILRLKRKNLSAAAIGEQVGLSERTVRRELTREREQAPAS